MVSLTQQVALQGEELKARIIGGAVSGPVQNRANWQSHLKGTDDEETYKDGAQDCRDYDEDNEGGFGVDVSPHLERQDHSLWKDFSRFLTCQHHWHWHPLFLITVTEVAASPGRR